MDDVLGLVELALYICAILALSMAMTWAVVKISPSKAAKEQKAQQKSDSATP